MENYLPLGLFVLGLAIGVLATLLTFRLRNGAVSPAKAKREMEDYQQQVEAHFDETSKKFESLASQYQDLYQHLSVGATSLCRPENLTIKLQSPNVVNQTKQKQVDKPKEGNEKSSKSTLIKNSEVKKASN